MNAPAVIALAALLASLAAGLAPAHAFIETSTLAARVEKGELPSVERRLPDEPLVVDMKAIGRQPGRHGGVMRMLMGKQKDIRMMTVYGYARFVGYDQNLRLKPDILKSYEVTDGRIFTFHLRKGHKWSDGHPFTSEDIRYAWQDVITDKDVSRGYVPGALLVNGKPPAFEVIDELTVRFTWQEPNPNFLPALAAPRPLFLAKPAHYLKQFHKKYQTPEKLKKLIAKYRVRNWRGLQIKLGRQYRPENPDLPTLDPWRNTTKPPAENFVFERNPYFHRVDENGRQLPYIDKVTMRMGSTSLIPTKTGAGESDLQARYIRFDNYTFLKEAESRSGYRVLLWRAGVGSAMALLPNLNVKDEMWRKLNNDVRFRRALSLAINRREINQVVFYGLAHESADSVLRQSPLYSDEYAKAWASHDPKTANLLLDAVGLTRRDSEGYRLLPNGERAQIIVETAGESTEQTDILELIGDHWREVGIKIFTRATQRDVLRRRVFSGQTVMSVWSGMDNAIPTPQTNPAEVAPSSSAQLQWPQWGQYYESNARKGEKPTGAALELARLRAAWGRSTTDAERVAIWKKMLKIYSDQVFSIGTVNGAIQPVVVARRLRNVPAEGIYSYSPGAFFGIYHMDAFWYEGEDN